MSHLSSLFFLSLYHVFLGVKQISPKNPQHVRVSLICVPDPVHVATKTLICHPKACLGLTFEPKDAVEELHLKRDTDWYMDVVCFLYEPVMHTV